MRRVLALLSILLGGTAVAQTLVGGAGGTLAEVTLVGSHGERWRRDGQGTWRQLPGGGVAVDLQRARGEGKRVWAVGERTPPFVHDGTSWSAVPMTNKGALVLGEGPLLAVAVGKRVQARVGDEWRSLGVVGKSPGQLWAASPKDAMILDRDGGVHLWNGSAWKLVKHPQPFAQLGGDGKLRWAARGDEIFAVNGGKARPLTSRPAGARVVVVRADRVCDPGPIACAAGPALPTGDAIVVALALDGGGALLATRRGGVFVREAGSWRREPLDASPAAQPTKAPNPPAPVP
jgi:hypothetical protein